MAIDPLPSRPASRQPSAEVQLASGRPPLARRLIEPAIVVLAAAVAVAPQIFRGNSCGHDFDFHLVSWLDCLHAWRHGLLYPHWAPSPNYGAGEPRFVFYPPLTWMMGAALGAVLPWPAVPIVLTFLLMAGTGLATRSLARHVLAGQPAQGPAATLAGCAAIFSGYALFTAYERTAFGELAGGFWIPLLLSLASRGMTDPNAVSRRTMAGPTVWLALVIAGSWLSNAPLGVMACYLLAAVALTMACLYRSWRPVMQAALAAALGIGLAAFYLIPAAWEQRWVDIRQATDDPGERIENSFLFGHNGGAALADHNVELRRVSMIAVLMIALALLGYLVAWRRGTLPSDKRRWLLLAAIPIAVLLLQLPFSLGLWNLLPRLRFLQFPWRWLVVLEAPMGLFFATAAWPRLTSGRWARVAVMAACGLAFATATAMAGRSYFQPCDDEDAVKPMVANENSGAGFEGTDEYAPIGADNSLVATALPDACLASVPNRTLGVIDTPGANPDWWVEQNSCVATFSAATAPDGERFHLSAVIPQPGVLILRLRRYPAWHVTINGRPAAALPQRDDGLIELPVARGPLDVSADWVTTPDVTAGRGISFLALLVTAALALLNRPSSKPRTTTASQLS
jgi:hypothetical protein